MRTKFLALVALLVGMASCQNDPEIVNPTVGGEVDFQLAVGVPELNTRAAEKGTTDTLNHANSAYGAIDYLQGVKRDDPFRTDWNDVDIRYSLEVYDKADGYTDAVPVKDRQVIIVDEYEPVAFNLRLVPDREYHFVVFADFVPNGSTVEVVGKTLTEHHRELGLHHIIGDNLGQITIKNDGINDECTDAYFATKDITIENSAAQDIELKRPYGKVRVIATDLNQLNINVDPAAVVVTYDEYHPNAFNAVTGKIGGKYEPNEYVSVYNDGVCKLVDDTHTGLANHFYTAGYDNYNSYGTENENGVKRHTHMTLFTDYILANEQQSPIHFTMDVYQTATPKGEGYEFSNLIKSTDFNTEIPIQRNFLTTIVGNVLTTATEIKVTIDDNFGGNIVVPTIDYEVNETSKTVYAYTADGLLKWSWLVANDSPTWSVKVMSNITMPMFTVEEDAANKTFKYTTTAITIDADGKPSGSNWKQVGTYQPLNKYIDAVVDGNNKTISNLTMYNENLITGFVGYSDNIEVKNLTFNNAKIYSTNDYVSPISYAEDGSNIYNINVKNSFIRGRQYVAGIVSMPMDHYDDEENHPYVTEFINGTRQKLMPIMTIDSCTTDENTSIVGTGSIVGGIAGKAYGCVINNCHNKADVTGNGYTGGIAGWFRDYDNGEYCYMVNCSSTDCTIKSSGERTGGIIGYIYDEHDGDVWVVGCYSNSTIESTKAYKGSLIGYNHSKQGGLNKIIGCYAVSTLSAIGSKNNNYVDYPYSFSFADAASVTAEAVEIMNDGIAEYNAYAAGYTFPASPVSARPMVLPQLDKSWKWTNGNYPVLQ